MSSLFNRVRNRAEKATFEADKLRRITAVQVNIRSLQAEFEKEVTQVGKVAFSVYQQGQITQPELLAACERIAAIYAQIQARELEIAGIKDEQFVEGYYDRICPNGHGPIPEEHNFCQECGAAPVEAPPPVSQEEPPNQPTCPRCQAPIRPGASFCSTCGQKVDMPLTDP